MPREDSILRTSSESLAIGKASCCALSLCVQVIELLAEAGGGGLYAVCLVERDDLRVLA